MSIYFDNVKIYSVEKKDGAYNKKKDKYVKYKKPKIVKKKLFEDSLYDLGELYLQLKNCHDRDPYNKMEVSFTTNLEY